MANAITKWLRGLVPMENTIPAGVDLPSKPMAFIWFFLRQIKPLLGIFIALEVLAAIAQLALPLLVSRLVELFSSDIQSTLVNPGVWLAVGFAVVFRPLAFIVYNYVLSNSYRPYFANLIRKQLHENTLRHSLAFFQNDFAGRIASKLSEVGTAIRGGIETLIGTTLYAIMVFLGAVGMVGGIHWGLSVLLAIWLAGYVVIGWYLIPKMREASGKSAHMYSTAVGHRVDTYSHIPAVKLFGGERIEAAHALENIHAHNQANQEVDNINLRIRSWIELSNAFLLFGLLVICLWLYNQRQINAAQVALTFTLAIQLLNMSGWVLMNTSSLAEAYGKVVDTISTLVKPFTVQDKPDAKALRVTLGSITLQDATHQYGRGVGGITGINLTIKPGELVGVVGASGAGKSTLVAAISRYFDLESGAILIDGQNIAHVTQHSLRQALGVVTQEAEIFHRSIRDNIAYGKPDATMDEIITAARKANAHDFIVHLQDPQGRNGYDAVVGERGIRLSGGQRQRIAIARTLLANRPILILDEATSALDSESEAAIQENLGLLMEGRTVIAIAHRLSTLKAMDRIVVMDNGQIVEVGSPQQLLDLDGYYAKLWRMQTEGFLPAEAA